MSYITTDIVLAATLQLKGYNISSIVVEGRRGTFTFNDVPPDIISDFHECRILVAPVAFHRALRDITTRVSHKIGMK
jgi:hypothetical protein